jgi:hypothetical protein
MNSVGTNLMAVRVTFDRVIQASTFTTIDATLTGPSGQNIGISSIRPVANSGDRSFDVVFLALLTHRQHSASRDDIGSANNEQHMDELGGNESDGGACDV